MRKKSRDRRKSTRDINSILKGMKKFKEVTINRGGEGFIMKAVSLEDRHPGMCVIGFEENGTVKLRGVRSWPLKEEEEESLTISFLTTEIPTQQRIVDNLAEEIDEAVKRYKAKNG